MHFAVVARLLLNDLLLHPLHRLLLVLLLRNSAGAQATLTERALAALPPHRQTDRLPEPDQQVIDLMPLVPRQPGFQRRARLLGRFGLVPAPQVRDAVDVHIDADAFGAAPRGAHAQVRHLGPHARKADESFDGIGDIALEAVAQDQRRGFDVLGLVVVEADEVDQFVEARGVDVEDVLEGEARGREVGLEAAHGDGVGGVFGLRGEHERDEGLEALVLRAFGQRGLDERHGAAEQCVNNLHWG